MSRPQVSRPITQSSASGSLRVEGMLALAGVAVFAVNVVLLHVLQAEVEPASNFISDYVLGGWGWLMNIAFLALAGALLAVAHGLRHGLSPGRRVTATVRLLYVGAITTVLSGAFNSDSMADLDAGRTSLHGLVHDLAGLIGFLALTVATFMLRGVFARDTQWHRFAPHALMFALAILGTFLLMMTAPQSTFGLAQRVFVTVDALWVGTLGCALLGAERVCPSQMEAEAVGSAA